jgi:hypothetical protein
MVNGAFPIAARLWFRNRAHGRAGRAKPSHFEPQADQSKIYAKDNHSDFMQFARAVKTRTS